MNILIDSAIFALQSQGGISRLWRSLLPALRTALPDATFTPSLPPDLFMSTYYRPAPLGVRSLVVAYDFIHERYPLIGANHSDAVDKRRAIAEASAVIAISAQVAGDVQRFCGKAAEVAYPGVDVPFGKVLPSDVERFQQFIGRSYILMVGRRGLYKNAQTLYQAWGLWSGAKAHKLVCIGGEDGLPQDVAFANRYKDTWQHLTLSDADLQLAYAGATALVYPSLMEGFGLPVVEAMACACPVVCDASMSEIAGDAAFYCDVTRPRQIAAAIEATYDYGIRLERATKGLERAKTYTWAAMAESVASAIRRAS